MCECCLQILTYSLFSCREIAELKVLLESQTDLNASLQRELQEGQQKAAATSQVKLTPCLHCKAHRSFCRHCCYRCILPDWTRFSSLMASPVSCLCIELSSVLVPVMLAFMMTSSSNNPVSLHSQEELSSLRQQVAESSVLRTQLETAQQEAAHNQSRSKELYNQLDAMSRRHEQVTAALLSYMQLIHQSTIFCLCDSFREVNRQ